MKGKTMSDDRSKHQPRPQRPQSGRQGQPPPPPGQGHWGDKHGDEKNPDKGSQPNEGEGNRSAARDYNQRTKRFANSGQVEKKAREARQAVDGEEGDELARAETEGKSHAAGTDRARDSTTEK